MCRSPGFSVNPWLRTARRSVPPIFCWLCLRDARRCLPRRYSIKAKSPSGELFVSCTWLISLFVLDQSFAHESGMELDLGFPE